MYRSAAGRLILTAIILVLGLGMPAAQAADGYRLLHLNGQLVKWGAPELGQAAAITYAVADGAVTHAGVRNCRHAGSIVPLLHNSAMSRTAFDSALKSAFALWQDAANIRFRAADKGQTPDILIAAQGTPDGIAYTDVALAGASHDAGAARSDTATLKAGIICLNPKLKWVAGDGARLPAMGKTYALTYALAHEIGHAIGLDHPGPTGELMAFRFDGDASLTGLQPGDRRGVIALYGAKPAPAAIAMVRSASATP
ncbi:MAG TPA: matrixin family metalloprotease [Rhizomicrobium sp.]|jgi:hypothetical protein|nr:matrixin family metalloprotease [Rhizomicrobium sp.]